jgi:hypothetical protein
MADKKITDLPEIPEVADDDYLEIVDTSANTSNKISRENLIAGHDHDSDYLGITGKAADSDKLDGNDSTYFMPQSYKDGWIPVSDTWTYKTATTITVPSGAASIYKVGMGIRLTQSSTVKYFYIVGVADTVLTVTGGSDYTLANATISAVSYAPNPDTAIGFPRVFQYATTITGYTTNPKTATLEFKMIGNRVYVDTYDRIDGNDSNATGLTFTLPVSAYGSQLVTALGYPVDKGSISTAPTGYIDINGTIASCYKQFYQGAWTASGRKALMLQPFIYLA